MVGQAKAFAVIFLGCLIIRQEYLCRRLLDDGITNIGIKGIPYRLRGKAQNAVLLTDCFHPVFDTVGENRIIKHFPALIEHDDGLLPVHERRNPMENIHEPWCA